MIAYKGTMKDGFCMHNMKYELGKVYTYEGELSIFNFGFHFCQELKSVHSYYSFDNSEIWEIEVLGEVITEGDRSVTNKFRLLRKADLSPFVKTPKNDCQDCLVEYDENGNQIYNKTHVGNKVVEWWRKYSDSNQVIYEREVTCYNGQQPTETEYKYDDKGNVIYRKNGRHEKHLEYNEFNKLVYSKSSDGFERRVTYHPNGHRKFEKTTNLSEYTKEQIEEFDQNGNLVRELINGQVVFLSRYDDMGNLVYSLSHGIEIEIKYDVQNRITYESHSNGIQTWHEYKDNLTIITQTNRLGTKTIVHRNSDGNEIYINDGTIEIWREYNSRGQMIHYRDSTGNERWSSFDENGYEISGLSNSFSWQSEVNEKGNILSYSDSNGTWYKNCFDENGGWISHVSNTKQWKIVVEDAE